MTRNIMVPLDGTRFAEAALPHAMQIAKRDGATLHLVIVWPPLPAIVDTAEWIQQLEEWENTRRAEDRAYIGEMARRVGDVLGTEVLAAYLSGQPEDELASWAMQEKIDLIVMATHGHGSIGRAWLGSVADRMVRKGNVPVMLIRPSESKPDVQLTPRRPFQKILIPLDGSLLAERALRKSLLVGGGAAAPEITLLTVVGFPIPMVTRGGALDSSKLGRALEDTAEVHLERMARHIAAWGCKVTTCVVTSPITWQAIVSFAETNGFDLIALATHGRGGAARLLMGSVADKVMRSSSVPTLLFHPEQIEGDAHRQMSAADAELAHSR